MRKKGERKGGGEGERMKIQFCHLERRAKKSRSLFRKLLSDIYIEMFFLSTLDISEIVRRTALNPINDRLPAGASSSVRFSSTLPPWFPQLSEVRGKIADTVNRIRR